MGDSSSSSKMNHLNPDRLYNKALSALVFQFKSFREEILLFPPSMQFDVYFQLYKIGALKELGLEMCDLSTIFRILQVSDKRLMLHMCFQALMDKALLGYLPNIATTLSAAFISSGKQGFTRFQNKSLNNVKTFDERRLREGLSLSSFLFEGGWLPEAESILVVCCQLVETDCEISENVAQIIECYQRLLRVQNGFCNFAEAEKTYNKVLRLVKQLPNLNTGVHINLASLYSDFSTLHMLRSNYTEAYNWCMKALKEIVPNFPPYLAVDVLRQCSKACVLKREFKKAEILIRQALAIVTELYGDRHPKYADVLIDYGFFLLNIDSVSQGLKVYQNALNVRLHVFGGVNLHVAVAHEDVAYALYVHNYSSGKFDMAKKHAEKAIDQMSLLLPADHLMLVSTKRVKALILEEVAIDSANPDMETRYLEEAHSLHKEALTIARNVFGEMNVQTAKHYGNLGRLYQSMKLLTEAEAMHVKAIQIKEEILGPDDYEVALSVGHLASLYNYDLLKFDLAEKLYLRSIAIGTKLFGEAYSGLEYDYRGLLRLYGAQENNMKVMEYQYILMFWKIKRDQVLEMQTSPFQELTASLPLLQTVELCIEV